MNHKSEMWTLVLIFKNLRETLHESRIIDIFRSVHAFGRGITEDFAQKLMIDILKLSVSDSHDLMTEIPHALMKVHWWC